MNKTKQNPLVTAYWTVFSSAMAIMATVAPVFAEDADIFARIKTMLMDIYDKIFGITTVIAVLAATVALVMRMTSSNQRTVDTATTWLKRIIISWVLINSMTYIVTYLNTNLGGNAWAGHILPPMLT